MDFTGKRALVIGFARSGRTAALLLKRNQAIVHIQDNRAAEKFCDLPDGLQYHWGEDPVPLLEGMDYLVISPGVHYDSPVVEAAKERGIPVLGEIELGYQLSQGRIIAITGTNGKTTTATLCGEMFKNAGKLTYVCGNIGNPLTGIAADTMPEDIIVLELSSYQLESIDKFRPQSSAILNIEPDHLDRHGDMENYTRIKARIFENQVRTEFTVLNYDDPTVRDLGRLTPAQVVYFSRKQPLSWGAWIKDDHIVFSSAKNTRPICRVDEIKLPGAHNLENALAAAALACVNDMPLPVIRHTLRTFTGVAHRIEFVREVGGVRFINDSKGTNVAATTRAVQAMERPTVILLGGYDEKADFRPLAERIASERNTIIHAVLLGETADAIEKNLRAAGYDEITRAKSFEEAVLTARAQAREGCNVLLSPACASFDMFRDYEQRGDIFKSIVQNMEE